MMIPALIAVAAVGVLLCVAGFAASTRRPRDGTLLFIAGLVLFMLGALAASFVAQEHREDACRHRGGVPTDEGYTCLAPEMLR